LAGGWQQLYAAKHLSEKSSHPWTKPCDFEVEAMVVHMMHNVLLGPTEDLSRQHSGGTSLATMDKVRDADVALDSADVARGGNLTN